MRLNTPVRSTETNHEGVLAIRSTPIRELRRSVLTCLLWEDSFYEDGVSNVERIRKLIPLCDASDVAALAIKARHEMKLRHVPLLIAREMARLPEHKALVSMVLENVIERPDEITEFLAIYWKEKRQPLSAQVKKGLAGAFEKFNAYQLAKYDREGKVRLRDALFLCHAKPGDAKKRYDREERKQDLSVGRTRRLSPREELYHKLIIGNLETPDTWETELSAGGDKRLVFERLLAEKKLGALALLRNLRNMRSAGVPKTLVASALETVRLERVLPFRFIAAARAVPEWEDIIEPAMLRCLEGRDKLLGKTLLLIDVSPSMSAPLSARSDLSRRDAALGLAILARELCEEVELVAFSTIVGNVPPRRGFALADAIARAVPSSGTLLGRAVQAVTGRYERLIVITDEQSQDRVEAPDRETSAYMLNVAPYKNGVGFGVWNRIDGWSEAVFDYIRELETFD